MAVPIPSARTTTEYTPSPCSLRNDRAAHTPASAVVGAMISIPLVQSSNTRSETSSRRNSTNSKPSVRQTFCRRVLMIGFYAEDDVMKAAVSAMVLLPFSRRCRRAGSTTSATYHLIRGHRNHRVVNGFDVVPLPGVGWVHSTARLRSSPAPAVA